MNTFKKTIALILSALMLMSAFVAFNAVSASAAEKTTVTLSAKNAFFKDISKAYAQGETFDATIMLQAEKLVMNSQINLYFDHTKLHATGITLLGGGAAEKYASNAKNFSDALQEKENMVTANFSSSVGTFEYMEKAEVMKVSFEVLDASAPISMELDYYNLSVDGSGEGKEYIKLIDRSKVAESTKNTFSIDGALSGGSEPEQPTETETTTEPKETETVTDKPIETETTTEPKETETVTDKPIETETTTEPKETETVTDKPIETETTTEPKETETVTDKPTETETVTENPTDTEATAPAKKDISNWMVSKIKNQTYTGKAIEPAVAVTNLTEIADISVTYKNNKNVGTATAVIMGKGDYTGTITTTFKIVKAKNTMTVKANAKAVKAASLKKKGVTVKKAITVKKNKGAVSYAAVKKSSSKGVSISKKGVITIKKGVYKKKATLKIVVKVTAKGTKNYKKLTKKVTVKIKVK